MTQITLIGYEIEGLTMPNKNIVINLSEVEGCSDGYEKNSIGWCIARYGWYSGDAEIVGNICLGGDLGVSGLGGNLDSSTLYEAENILNIKNDVVKSSNGTNICEEGYHIFTLEEFQHLHLYLDSLGSECIKKMIGEYREICDDQGCHDDADRIIPHFIATSEHSMGTIGYIYDENGNQFGKGTVIMETDPESGDTYIVTELSDISSDILSGDAVMCATYYPIVTFVDVNGNIVEQKGLAPGTQITLTGYEIEGLTMPNKNIVINLSEVEGCSVGYEKQYNGECIARNGWYKGDFNIQNVCVDETTEVGGGIFSGTTIYENGNILLNVKSGTETYNNDMNTCGEGYHILTFEDAELFDLGYGDAQCFEMILGESQVTTQHEPGDDDTYDFSFSNHKYPPFDATSENSMSTAGYIYNKNQNQFGKQIWEIVTDTEDPEVVVYYDDLIAESDMQPDAPVVCATYYPIATFLNEQGEIIAQKPIPAGTTIELTGYTIMSGKSVMPGINSEFVVGGCAEGYHEENNECILDEKEQSEPKNNNYSGGGGGSTKTDTSKEEKPEKTPEKNPQNNNQQESSPETQDDKQNTKDSSDKSPIKSKTSNSSYTNEQKDAYEFAKENGITTMPTIEKADIDGKLTRIQMAKMLSQYAINVLGKAPDTSKSAKFKDVSDKLNLQYDNGVILAYQLGIMGQNMKNEKFRPNDEVSRAEFATALSRLLYSTSDGVYKSTSKYYIHHMEKLKEKGIITNDAPNMKEKRGYVTIMLMRSAKLNN